MAVREKLLFWCAGVCPEGSRYLYVFVCIFCTHPEVVDSISNMYKCISVVRISIQPCLDNLKVKDQYVDDFHIHTFFIYLF